MVFLFAGAKAVHNRPTAIVLFLSLHASIMMFKERHYEIINNLKPVSVLNNEEENPLILFILL